MEETEDVYRFQEIDSEDEKQGVMVEPAHRQASTGRPFNPDELYFNDMDLRAWERRTADTDPMAYGDDYGYPEDEGYYEEGADVTMSQAEYEELLFQRVLDKIKLAKYTGDTDIQLSSEELDAYQARLMRNRAPAVHPPARSRPVSASTASVANTALVPASSSTSGQGSSSTRSKKSQQRTSLFSSRPKKEKPSGRKRTTSNVSNTTNNTNITNVASVASQAPGFMIPGPNGQLVFAPISAYQSRSAREGRPPSIGPPSGSGSRSASISSRHAPTPPRVSPPREVPGAFPTGSPMRPSSSSSRQSSQDNVDWQGSSSRSGSVQHGQAAKLVPFPVFDYQHFTAEPYQYYNPGQPSSQQTQAPPSYTRRVAPGQADSNHTNMPRRVPVPQRAAVPMSSSQGGHSDPTLARANTFMDDVHEEDGLGVMVDVIPQADDRGYKVQTATSRSSGKESSSKESERKRRSGKSRRKP